jgi:hypothetical protein
VRRRAYWALFSGAHGHTYGTHPIWQMYAPPKPPVWDVKTPWYDAMDLPGVKQLALGELHAYSREIWRRAYANGRFVEAVALPAMAAMLTIRNQIGRMSNWPGGWMNVLRCAVWTALPAISWFGPQAAAWLIQPFLL